MAVTLEGTYRLIDRATPALDRIQNRARAADRALERLGRQMDKIAARSEVQKLAGLAGGMDKVEKSTGRVERVMARTGVTARVMNRDMENTSSTSRKVEKDMGRLETAMRKVLVIGGGLGKIFGHVFGAARLGGMAALVQPAIGAIQGLGAGAIALVQQLGQATGAVVPLVGRLADLAGVGAAAATVMLSVKAAALVTKFAMAGVSSAIHGNVAAFKLLTPQARAFVLEMRKLQPLLNTIRSSAQRGLFPGLTGAVRTARNNGAFQAANTAAGGIGGAVGNLAQRAASQLLSPSMLRDLVSLSGTAQVVITRLGGAAMNLGQAFVSILVAAQPLTRWLVTMVDHWSKYLLQQVQIARASGALARYFENTRRTVTVLARAVRDFGMGFINIMRIARGQSTQFGAGLDRIAKTFRTWTSDTRNQARMALWFQRAQASAHRLALILVDTLRIFQGLGKASQSLGQTMTGGIEQTMRRWATWTNSFRGQNVLSQWFSTARTTLAAMWRLLSALGGAFMRLGQQGGGAAGLLNKLTALVPDLEKVLRTFGQQLGPGLFTTVTQLAHLLATLTAAGGSPLGMILSVTAGILTNVNHILDSFHGVRTAAAIAVTAIGGALLLRKLAGIAGGVGSIAAMWAKVTGNTIAATEAVGAYGAVAGGGSVGASAARATAMERNTYLASQVKAGTMSRAEAAGLQAVVPAARADFIGPTMPPAARVGGLRGLLARPGVGMGIGIGLPVIGGMGSQLLAGQGVISQGSANIASGVLSGAGTGAMLGGMLGPWGMAGGAVIGGAAGLLMGGMGGGGQSPTQKYLAGLAKTAQNTGTGFDINAAQGGATTLAGANQFQRVLDQSLMGLQAKRRTMTSTNAYGSLGTDALHQLDQQIAANQALRHQNIARLNVERGVLAEQKKQTAEIAKQNRERLGRRNAAIVGGQYMQAYNTYRQAGWSVQRATHQVVGDMETRAAHSNNPAFALGLAQGGTAWLAQMKKVHPELKAEYDGWNKTLKKTLDRMGVTISTSGDTVLKATGKQWGAIRDAIANPAEVAKERVATAFTALQNQAVAMLVAMGGMSLSQARAAVAMGDAGAHPLPSVAYATATNMGPKPRAKGFLFSSINSGMARGGRIPGVGLEDTVPLGRALAAPGELVVNRHTESKADRVLRMAGTSLGGLVAGETRRHSDILPGLALGGRVGAAVAEASRINSLHIPYLFGGGHNSTPAPANGPFDCSSSTSRVLQAAGYKIPTMTSGSFMNWGAPGPGAIGIAANRQHVYMMLNGRAWGTSGSNPGGGPGWIKGGTYRPGFVVRHAPGAAGGGGGSVGTSVGGNMLMPALDYSMFGTGLGGVPMAASLQVGSLVAAGLQGRINRRLRAGAGARPGFGGLGGTMGMVAGGGTPSRRLHSTALLSGNQRMYLAAMARVTGLDPNVLGAWLRNEEPKTNQNTDPRGHGRYNFLNVGITDSAPYGAASSWWNTTPSVAGAATGQWLLGKLSIPGFGKSAASIQALGGVAGMSPQAQISAIQRSGWASGGETLMPSLYQQISGSKFAKGGRLTEWGGWHAGGLDRTFDRPTMIGVGERGREHVSVTPGGGGGGRSVTINMGGITINGGNPADVQRQLDYWAEELARMIERQSTVGG